MQTASRDAREALNERLWTYAEDTFLPHGGPGDGDPTTQPIYLCEADETPNGAQWRVLLNPADAPRFVADPVERVFVMFEARDVEAMEAAREAWKALREAGASPSYWREGDDGGFVKAR